MRNELKFTNFSLKVTCYKMKELMSQTHAQLLRIIKNKIAQMMFHNLAYLRIIKSY